MNRRRANAFFLIVLAGLFLSAARTGITAQEPCDPRALLDCLRALFPAETTQIHCITIAEDDVLSIFSVAPELDPNATGDAVSLNARAALLHAAKAALRVLREYPCAGDLYSAINPMVVDAAYNVWYIDIIPIAVFQHLSQPTDRELLTIMERNSTETHYRRNRCAQPPGKAPGPGFTSWGKIAPALLETLNDRPGRVDIAAYYLVFNHERIVQVYWEALDEDDLKENVVRAKAGSIKGHLARLWPKPDALEIYVTDPAGRTLIFSRVRGDQLIKPGPIPANEFIMQRIH